MLVKLFFNVNRAQLTPCLFRFLPKRTFCYFAGSPFRAPCFLAELGFSATKAINLTNSCIHTSQHVNGQGSGRLGRWLKESCWHVLPHEAVTLTGFFDVPL
jgi:hypothetical protein